MLKLRILLAGASVALLIAACSKPEPPAAPEPEPAAAEPAPGEIMRGPDAGDTGGSDPTVVDPDHYTTEFENDAVRVLRITYGPGEESVMHYHPDAVAVFITDQDVEMTMPDGSTQPIAAKARDVLYVPGGQHLPRNTADSAFELVLVELK